MPVALSSKRKTAAPSFSSTTCLALILFLSFFFLAWEVPFCVKLLVELLSSCWGSIDAVEFWESTGLASNFERVLSYLLPWSASASFMTDSSCTLFDLLSFSAFFLPLSAAYNYFFGTTSINVSFLDPDVMVAFGNNVRKFYWKLFISQPFLGRKTGRFKFQILGSF